MKVDRDGKLEVLDWEAPDDLSFCSLASAARPTSLLELTATYRVFIPGVAESIEAFTRKGPN